MISLEEAYRRITDEERQRSLVITDPHLDDNPIVFVSDAFVRQTGYAREEALGRNCRFLQGPDTDPAAVRAIHEAIARAETITVDILNYRRDGSPFWNRLRIRPRFLDCGAVENFVGVQNRIEAADARTGPMPGIRE